MVAVHPDNAPASGGTPIRVVGYNFDGSPGVTVGGTACTVTANTKTELTCTLGASTAGFKDVVVTNAGSDTLSSGMRLTSTASGGDVIGAGVVDRPATVQIIRDTWSQAVFGRVT